MQPDVYGFDIVIRLSFILADHPMYRPILPYISLASFSFALITPSASHAGVTIPSLVRPGAGEIRLSVSVRSRYKFSVAPKLLRGLPST